MAASTLGGARLWGSIVLITVAFIIVADPPPNTFPGRSRKKGSNRRIGIVERQLMARLRLLLKLYEEVCPGMDHETRRLINFKVGGANQQLAAFRYQLDTKHIEFQSQEHIEGLEAVLSAINEAIEAMETLCVGLKKQS